jgi:hypothetical protein
MTEITESKSATTPHKHRRASAARQARMGVQGLINLVLTILTVRDIRKRSDDEIKGNRKLWMLAAFAPPIGPIAYLVFGRKPGTHTVEDQPEILAQPYES